MDLKPGMKVLDLCAAPGSKSAQLIEMIHGGEEERIRKAAGDIAEGLDPTSEEGFTDDGRSSGLLIANDVDYKRAHMLVHQMKRLSSPNVIVTNHDATVFPSIKLPSEPSADGKNVSNKYLKFDRILADVPCSGDGTSRKNLEIWKNWTPSNGLGLHMTQVRILIRALQMLKVGGRVVYSTCSMNPVEDEAVLAHAIDRCGGSGIVDVLPTSDYLPGLVRYPGLRRWKVMDKVGRIWETFQDVVDQKANHGDDGLGRLQESMFPPDKELPLERCMRIYPHQQDTGAFFIAILEKKSEIKARTEGKSNIQAITITAEATDVHNSVAAHATSNGGQASAELNNGVGSDITESTFHFVSKRKRTEDYETVSESKRIKGEEPSEIDNPYPTAAAHDCHDLGAVSSRHPAPTENGVLEAVPEAPSTIPTPTTANGGPINAHQPSDAAYKTKRKMGQPFEEPFKYLNAGAAELQLIREFYKIAPRFPQDRFMVRNATGLATKNIYYTTALAKSILQENEGKGIKFVHSGVKMFVKQDVPSPDVCPWRIQTDGLAILEAWVGPERTINLTKRETLRKLLIEMFPRFHGDGWKHLGEIGEPVRDIGMGCCVLRVEPSQTDDGLRSVVSKDFCLPSALTFSSERMVFPLWKSIHSLNLMLPKEERRAMLLRLFNDDTPLRNLTLKQAARDQATEPKVSIADTPLGDRNSSSPDIEASGGGNIEEVQDSVAEVSMVDGIIHPTD